MQAEALLTQDELDFIQNMQHSPQLNLADPMSSLLVNGDRRIQSLLTRLVANEQVTLQAQFNNQQISFPLQLVEDEFHALHLQLGSPEIYEDGPMLRPWRLSMEQPSALLDGHGQESGLWVRDISFKGTLLEVRGLPAAPARFELRFAPGGIPPSNCMACWAGASARTWPPMTSAKARPKRSNACATTFSRPIAGPTPSYTLRYRTDRPETAANAGASRYPARPGRR